MRWLLLLVRDAKALSRLGGNTYLELEFITMLMCFARVLWVSVRTTRDSFWSGLLHCIGLGLSFDCYSNVAWGKTLGTDLKNGVEELGCTMLTLYHSNVHPITLWLLFCCGTAVVWYELSGYYDSFVAGLDLHAYISLFFLLCAFTVDFSNRIQAVSSGILYGRECDSSVSAALQSPVAGRSARKPCWLVGLNAWIWWLIYMREANLGNTRVVRASVVLCFLVLLGSICAERVFLGWKADIVFGLLCHLPPLLLFLDADMSKDAEAWNNKLFGGSHALDRIVLFDHSQFAHLLATQTLIQAGCHPAVCAVWAAPLLVIHLIGSPILNLWKNSDFTAPEVGFALLGSHFVDYFPRIRAIQEGLASSEENARSIERLPRTSIELLGLTFENCINANAVAFSLSGQPSPDVFQHALASQLSKKRVAFLGPCDAPKQVPSAKAAGRVSEFQLKAPYWEFL